MAKGPAKALSVDNAWNNVALEERLELIAEAQASGIWAAMAYMLMMGAIAYGFDAIWLLAVALVTCTFIMPLFSSYRWRRGKPELILKYLAARSMARRYGYSYQIPDLDVSLTFRGQMQELFVSHEAEMLQRQSMDVDIDTVDSKVKDVWVVLLGGGLIVLGERAGGAKLEFIAQSGTDMNCNKGSSETGVPEQALVVTGTGAHKGKQVAIWSRHVGAMYVFEKKLLAMIDSARLSEVRLEALRRGEHKGG